MDPRAHERASVHMNHKLRISIPLIVGLVFLSGCSAPSTPNATTPSSSPESSEPASATVDPYLEFRKIAETSCNKAYDEGVTETVEGVPNRLVLLPVSFLYNDFFAAVVSDEGGVGPIWSSELFAVCVDYVNFMMAEESGSEYEIVVSGDTTSGPIRTEYTVEDYGAIVTEFKLKDGVFIEAWTQSPESESVTLIEYGIPSEQDIEHFREAIDLFLAEQ